MRTKMPVPMMAPTPRAVSWTAEDPVQPVLPLGLVEDQGQRLAREQWVRHVYRYHLGAQR
jgi:hypothetical protein